MDDLFCLWPCALLTVWVVCVPPTPADREAALWEMEEHQLQERHQLVKQQLKDQYFLQRHDLLRKHEKVRPGWMREGLMAASGGGLQKPQRGSKTFPKNPGNCGRDEDGCSP